MKRVILMVLTLIVLTAFTGELYGQRVLRKLQNRTEDKILDEIFNKDENEKKNSSNSSDPSGTGNIENKRGSGLTETAPDVIAQIEAASGSYTSKEYSKSRHAIRQALLGVEMEIGEKVLELLPASVNGLEKQDDSDMVTSSGIGFVGLSIERKYAKGDQELNLDITNNSQLLTAVNMYISSGTYSSGEDQEYKQVNVQGYQGVIEYDDYSGYQLSIPFGQSSLFVLQGINFENEHEIIDAANEFSIDSIKKQLGEQ